jgi:hypothetical protein
VTGFLLDTDIVLLALATADRLTSTVRSAVLRGPNVVSAVTFWEVTLKAAKGKLDVGDRVSGGQPLSRTLRRRRFRFGSTLPSCRTSPRFTMIRSIALSSRKRHMKIWRS